MKRFVLFSCLIWLSVEAVRVDPNLGPLLNIYHPYSQGLSSLQNQEVRGKLKKVEIQKKLEEPQVKKVIHFDHREEKKEIYDDKSHGVYGPGVKDQKGKKNVRGVIIEEYKDGRRYEGRREHTNKEREGYSVEEILDGKRHGYDRRYKNEGYGGIGYELEELSKDGRRYGAGYGAGYDYGLEYYLKNGRYNDGYGTGLVLDDSKDLYRRYKNERDRDYYVGYAGYGTLPDYKDRNYKNYEQEKYEAKGIDYGKDQKDRKYKNEGYGVGFVFEDPKQYLGYKDGYVGIGYANGELEKVKEGLINIGYNDEYYNRGDDKYRDVFGLGYKDAYGYGIGYGEEGFDKIKNYRRFRDGYDYKLSPEGLDKLNEDNIFRYTYLKRINGETHYKTGLFYYPFDYQVIGRHGLGYDRRSAQALGLAAPITPRELQPVGYYRFYKLEREPRNEYIADYKYQKDIYKEDKAK